MVCTRTADAAIPYAHSIADYVCQWLEVTFLKKQHVARLTAKDCRQKQQMQREWETHEVLVDPENWRNS